MTCVMGPLQFAGSCIQSGKLQEALPHLDPQALWGSLERGIAQTAALAGVNPGDVESLLPMGELRACIEQLTGSYRMAAHAWSVHAGHLGGLLKGLTDLTVDGRPPDSSVGLMRVARKLSRDKAVAAPLQHFADDIGRWQELLLHARNALDQDAGGLLRAYRRRRVRKLMAVCLPALLVIAGVLYLLSMQRARARLDSMLADADPCIARSITPADVERGSAAQRNAVTERLRVCDEQITRQAREREEQQRREAQARESERLRTEREARCDALATRMETGKLSGDDESFEGAPAGLLRRIQTRTLTPADFGPEGPALPCTRTPGEARLFRAFADAAFSSVWTWVTVVDPSPTARNALARRSADMPERARTVLGLRAVETARKAIMAGDPTLLTRAQRLCDFAEALTAVTGQPCQAARALAARP
ncbi:Hypothetical protein CAP_5312 [Chondromyces apiculatus DSM 436]|uniref:Uncharacterized protein n=2 Tax=Chondromyces apiculatus TaxID=51 RepID=A0A017T567_9BACT|nr:Hypothetical protein CAP_5312 [Chondromyces apiculatus DSM 436]